MENNLINKLDVLQAHITRTKAITTTVMMNFCYGGDSYHTINEETVAGLLWQIETNLDLMNNLSSELSETEKSFSS
jgi:hypothetical protein